MMAPHVSTHVMLSGCSGGGKSTLLAALAHRGYRTVPEPGRRIVEEQLASGGHALPWVDLAAFAERAIALAIQDRARAKTSGPWTFFDRGLIDAAVALHHAGGDAVARTLEGSPRYHRQVFLTPPWREIYIADEERRHGFEAATAEYERLVAAYQTLGYEILIVPRRDVAARAEFVLQALT